MRGSWFALLFVAGFVDGAHSAAATEGSLHTLPGHVRFSYDRLTLPGAEKMGLMGGNVLFEPIPWGYFGMGAYGAVSGNRGGFFTGGFEAGVQTVVASGLRLEGGLFVGGGGGGAAPQGGGLMLRPHADLIFETRYGRVGAGVSHVRFPNGAIRSTQVALTMERRFFSLYSPGWLAEQDLHRVSGLALGDGNARFRQRRFALQSIAYFPQPGTRGRSGEILDGRMGLVGIRWRQWALDRWMWEFETAGAWGGQVDGFAQVLFGGGYHFRPTRYVEFATGAMLGGAGGGDVDTAGGGIYRFYAGVSGRLIGPWWITAEAGYTAAFQGAFAAALGTLGLTYEYEPLTFTSNGLMNIETQRFRWARWQLRAATQRYIPIGSASRKNGANADVPVDLVAIKTDAWFAHQFYFSGQALGAYDGGAGGYAVGLVGLGWSAPLSGRLKPGAELLVGAAGGGGIAIGGGFLVQPMLNLSYQLNERFVVQLSYGYAAAPADTFTASVVDLSIAYRFATVHRVP